MIVSFGRIDQLGGTLPSPVANARSTWSARTGLRLVLRSDDGRQGVGEASPLPGYSPESLDESRAALQAWSRRAACELDLVGTWQSQVDAIVGSIPTGAPSARFALETALLDLIGQALGVPLERLLGGALRPVSWAGVIEASRGAPALERAGALLDAGVRTLKVKVDGRGPWDPVVRFLRTLRAQVGPAVRIRVDANRSVQEHELPDRLASLAALETEFVEEPCEPAAVVRLAASPVQLALDETLQANDAEALIGELAGTPAGSGEATRYAYVVLKPTVLGGLRRCAHLAELARSRGARAIISHTLEGPIGWTACAALALSAGDVESAAGLEPNPGLKTWPKVELPNLDGARIVPQERPGLGLVDMVPP